jgi:hypothetical protein
VLVGLEDKNVVSVSSLNNRFAYVAEAGLRSTAVTVRTTVFISSDCTISNLRFSRQLYDAGAELSI